MTEREEKAGGLLEWCVVANVAGRTVHGPGGADVQDGLKHFAPGARLWVFPPRYQGEDERLQVVGRHRGRGSRHVNVIVFRRHLESFRIKALHSPAVQRAKGRNYWSWNRVWCCPEAARPWVDRWNLLASGVPSEEFPPWPVRRTFSPAETCPHGSAGTD
ncbi:hypothetical protein ACFV1L_28740 [Kitasatospora sp. NPDC059646]|uniref:hypothetical protein n=1 Tax=Kitasatospora sp. NPDC059646 TaxID=3346893 RepID=UPI0036C4E19B